MTAPIADAAERLCRTAAASSWTGPDIYDALGARWPSVLTGGRRRRQALIQLHARAPVDLRPLSRRTHARIAKGVALFAMAELRLASLGEAERHREAAGAALDLVAADRTAGDDAWGYPWDVQTRWSHYRAGTPNVIVTSFAAQALQEGALALARQDYARRAAAASAWVHRCLYDEDLGVYAYHPGSKAVIHNASLLGARAAWAASDEDPSIRPAVTRAVERTVGAQLDDGSFPYGEGPGLEFVDSFHTGYVLECLSDLASVDVEVEPALRRGIDYYESRFFDPRGRALLWPSRPYPEDAHSAGTALTTLARLHEAGWTDRALLERVATRAAEHMARGGHAIHRRYRWGSTRVRYVRWADAHLALGLANAALALSAARPAGQPGRSAPSL